MQPGGRIQNGMCLVVLKLWVKLLDGLSVEQVTSLLKKVENVNFKQNGTKLGKLQCK